MLQGVQTRTGTSPGRSRNSWTRASTSLPTPSAGGDSARPASRAVVGCPLDSVSVCWVVTVARGSEAAMNGAGLSVVDCRVRVQATSDTASATTINVVLKLGEHSSMKSDCTLVVAAISVRGGALLL